MSVPYRDSPNGWRWATLADLADVVGGLAKGKKRSDAVRLRSVPYLRVANVQRGHIDLSHVKSIEATEDEVRELRLQPGDVLLNEGGDRDKLGRGWVWKGQLPECIHQNHVFRARIRDAAILPELLSYYANSEGQRYFTAQGKQTTNLASISLARLRGLPIPVPAPAQQRALLASLDSHCSRLDAATATLERVQRNLERYRASVLKAAVEGRLVPTEAELARKEGRTYEPASELLKHILAERRRRWEEAALAKLKAKGKTPTDDRWKARYEEPAAPDLNCLPELPEGWCWASVAQLGSISGGVTKNAKREKLPLQRPYLRVANVYANELRLTEIKHIGVSEDEAERTSLLPGDLLIVEGNGSVDQIGRVALWDGSVPGCVHQNHIIKVRLRDLTLARWSLTWLLSAGGRKHIEGTASSTSGLHTLSLSKVASLPLPLAPSSEQRRVHFEVERILSEQGHLQCVLRQACHRTGRLRQSILKWAFEGRLVDPSADAATASSAARTSFESPSIHPQADAAP